MDAIQMRELARPEPSLVSSIHDGGRRKSLLDDVELDDIVDWVKEGDLVPVDPEDVIEQQVNSILTGRRDSPPKPCTDAGMSHNTRLAQTMMEPTSMLFNSQVYPPPPLSTPLLIFQRLLELCCMHDVTGYIICA